MEEQLTAKMVTSVIVRFLSCRFNLVQKSRFYNQFFIFYQQCITFAWRYVFGNLNLYPLNFKEMDKHLYHHTGKDLLLSSPNGHNSEN